MTPEDQAPAGSAAATDYRPTIPVIAPSTGAVFAEAPAGGAAEIDSAVARARAAIDGGDWSQLTAVERGRLLMRLGQLILDQHKPLAQLEARDTGKPMSQARADITAAARYFEFYGAAADKLHGDTIPFLNGYTVLTLREPYGVTGHIIPWNYPAQMIGRTLAPSLAAGNATVLKPAEEAFQTPMRIAALAIEAGFPEGAINLVPGYGEVAGAALAAHDDINFLSFTGSPEVGTLVQAAAARNHIGCVLELGGKSPQIVFDDANLDKALPFLVKAIVQNGGQTCAAGSRVLVQASLYDTLIPRLAAAFSALTVGPHEADADCGPLISAAQRDRVEGFIARAERDGIALLATGQMPADLPPGGFYVAPTLYGPVPREHELAREEVFGPVLSVLTFDDEADAIRLANDTAYGLVAGIWTRDGARQLRVARQVRAGQVFVNGYGAGGGIELPFGGVGKSGHGREKGLVALEEFTQLKTVVLNHG